MATVTQTTWDLDEMPSRPVRRFTVAEYHMMIGAGVFVEDDRFELLEGWIVPKISKNPPHSLAWLNTLETLRSLMPPGWHLRPELPITTADSEPEPDFSIARGGRNDYGNRNPSPGDLALVIEIADSTLAQDRGQQARIYARAGIATYWIINIVDRQVEIYTDPTGPDANPRYRLRQDVAADRVVSLTIPGQPPVAIEARNLLP